MGSLNGDVMVMRNGRSTSQVSIYNYPEHLNPFYEDDQHKRLRFWKINKKDNEGRRNSFSIGNLKDMWAFKSFRMKKKSSTLGINKTSESPPTLRRDYAVDNGWNTFDHRLRVNNGTSLNSDNFQRNATYRSSLQTLPTANDRIGLNRNDGYRSTIQVTRSNQRYQQQQQQQQRPQSTEVSHNRRYVYGGSVTPQPLRNTNFGRGPYENDYNIVVRRSSQSSMVSTNPFESDDDENEDIISSGIRSVNGGSTTTLTSRTPRKKRRAPAPPTPIHNHNAPPLPTIRIESSHDTTNDELRIEEDIDIANLTAEIQNFVETTNNDNVEITQNSDNKEKVSITTASPKIIITNDEKHEAKEEQNSCVKAVKSTSEVIEKHEMVSVIEENTSKKNTSKDLINNSIEKEKKADHKTDGKITTEVVTVTTTERKTSPSKISNKVNKPSEIEQNTNNVSNEIVTKANESNEIKSNGAIPKKPNNTADTSPSADEQQQQQQKQQIITVVDELCIKETNNENVSPKPIPLKRHTKPEPEVGHVECIHVHVDSPKATPRKDHNSGMSSFKADESHEASESITTKTPFVLTSPPSQKKIIQSPAENFPVTKETVIILKSPNSNERVSELNIKEERINAKPEILIKPTLSPKPILKGINDKKHGFAEIHKPIRSKFSNNQNGHVKRISRDDSISPPLVPLESVKEKEENKIKNSKSTGIDTNEKKSEIETENKLTIIENCNAARFIDNKSLEVSASKEPKEISSKTAVKSAKEFLKHDDDDELDLLYRPKPPVTQMEWKRSTLAPLETNIPPEKRKSVKDIIESINRSQRLLNAAANKDFTTLNTTTTNPCDGVSGVITTHTETVEATNHKETFNETQTLVKHKQNNVEEINGAAAVSPALSPSPSPSPSPSNSNYNNEHADAQKLDNNEIFQKCKVKKEVYDYRESSPISSNLDWNPVPKPKRTKPGQD